MKRPCSFSLRSLNALIRCNSSIEFLYKMKRTKTSFRLQTVDISTIEGLLMILFPPVKEKQLLQMEDNRNCIN